MRRALLLVALVLGCADGGNTTVASPAPGYAQSTLQVIRSTGRAPEGYRGGTRFFNDGRDGGAALPTAARDGAPIRYQEWDVHPWVRGVNRGAERLITGSDGSAYFTGDHYRTFIRLTP